MPTRNLEAFLEHLKSDSDLQASLRDKPHNSLKIASSMGFDISKEDLEAAIYAEDTDQELSLDDLKDANGGFLLLLLSGLMPGSANAPAPGDDIYLKPSLIEIVKTGSLNGEADGTEPSRVAPSPDGKGCTDRGLPL